MLFINLKRKQKKKNLNWERHTPCERLLQRDAIFCWEEKSIILFPSYAFLQTMLKEHSISFTVFHQSVSHLNCAANTTYSMDTHTDWITVAQTAHGWKIGKKPIGVNKKLGLVGLQSDSRSCDSDNHPRNEYGAVRMVGTTFFLLGNA